MIHYYAGPHKPVLYDSSVNALLIFDGSTWRPVTNFIPDTGSDTNLNSCCDTLKAAFLNNDPASQPVKRAVYIGSSPPSNPIANMLWFDTSASILKLYDGANWNAINDFSNLNNSISDLNSQVNSLNSNVNSLNSQVNTINNSVNTLTTQISNLNSAFMNNDPTKTILRAVYIGNTAPSNPVAGTTWLDTSQSTPTLKVYNGNNWQTVSSSSSSSNRVDLSNATDDYNLDVNQEAIINFSNTSSVPLHIATQNGTYYQMDIILSNTSGTSGGGSNPVYLNPNNTTYSNAFVYQEIFKDGNGQSSSSATYNAFRIGWAISTIRTYIVNYTVNKHVKGIYYDTGVSSAPAIDINTCYWKDTSTAWTSLGTITLPQSSSGYILVKRLV